MQDTTKALPFPAPLLWGLLWFSQFVTWSCLQLILVAAIQMPPRHSQHMLHTVLPPRPPDYSLPLLLAAVMASAMTWQGWHSHKNGESAFKPKKTAVPVTKDRTGLVLVVFFGGVIELMWTCGVPGTRVNWPLLAALDLGLVAGGLGLTWALRRLPDKPGMNWDPLAPASSPAPAAIPQAEPYAPKVYGDGGRWTLPEPLIGFVAFLCLLAMIALAFIPGMSSFMHPPLTARDVPLLLFFGGMGAMIAVGMAAGVMKNRRDAGAKWALPQDKEASSAFVGFAAIGLICAFGTGDLHQNWPLLIGCGTGMYVAFLSLRWAMTRPLSLSVPAEVARVDWLPKRGTVRATPTEIVLQADPVLRLGLGLFAVLGMGGMTLVSAVIAIDPGLFGRYPHGLPWRLLFIALFLGMAFFTYICLGVLAPQNLRLALNTRTYTQETWKAMPGASGKDGFLLIFQTQHLAGSIDEDMAGVCLKEFRREGTVRYLLQLAWKDKSRPPRTLRSYPVVEQAKDAMAQAADALGLPALGRCE